MSQLDYLVLTGKIEIAWLAQALWEVLTTQEGRSGGRNEKLRLPSFRSSLLQRDRLTLILIKELSLSTQLI